MDHERARALMDAQFARGPLAPEEAASLREHQRACAECRAYYDRLVEIEGALEGRGDPEAELERMRALGPPRLAEVSVLPRRSLRRGLVAGGLALAAAVATAAILWRRPASEDYAGVRGGPTEPKGRAAWIKVFQAAPEGPRPLGDSLPAGQALLFSYTNLRGSPHRYVAIGGLDAAGRAHWYHPAFERAEQEPRSIAILEGAVDKELGEAVFAEHAPGPLEICAIFSDTALEVKALDRQLEATRRWPDAGTRDCVNTRAGPRTP